MPAHSTFTRRCKLTTVVKDAPIPFLKMNGLGNDFVIIDGRKDGLRLTEAEVGAIGNRETGIGCDQLIVMEQTQPGGADVFMRIYNGVGEEVGACGNAARCIAHLVMDEQGTDSTTIETVSGVLTGTRADNPQWVTIDMGSPRLEWHQIPLAEEFHNTARIELQIGPIDDPILHSPGAVNVGNPHAVFFVKDVEAYDLAAIGPMLEHHMLFPERANISLVQMTAPDAMTVKTWERGAGLTCACGTAACASLVAAVRRRLSERKATVTLPGGDLVIEWRESDNHVLMSGPFTLDYEAEIPPEMIAGNANTTQDA